MKINGFILSLLIAIVAAYFFPQWGNNLPLKSIIDIGIGFIFFFYGLKISSEELRLGMRNYKLHFLVHGSTYILFPLLVLAVYPFFEGAESFSYWLAFFFLAALPSTVSSSVVMVSLANGNVPAAIFNASLSGIIGVVLTPIWLSIFMNASEGFSIGHVFIKLFYQIILPLIIGFVLQRFFRKFVNTHKSKLALFDKSVIVLIVYSSFSDSFQANLFSGLTLMGIITLFVGVSVLFFSVYFFIGRCSKTLHFNQKDKITAQFCGSKKSLVHGSAMAKIIFGSSPKAGLFLLPVMLYHIVQLLVVSYIAENISQKKYE